MSLWWVEAGKYKVLPIDGSLMLRFTTDRPHLTRARSSYVFYPGLSVVPIGSAPAVFNRPHSITAEVEIPDGGATRVVGTAPPKDVGCDYGREVSGPSWSPDGSEIAFGVTDCADQTYVVPAAGGNRRLVGDGSQTVWSPDGEHIAVVSYNGDLVVMRPDGSAQLEVHVLPGHWRHPVWATLPSPPHRGRPKPVEQGPRNGVRSHQSHGRSRQPAAKTAGLQRFR